MKRGGGDKNKQRVFAQHISVKIIDFLFVIIFPPIVIVEMRKREERKI